MKLLVIIVFLVVGNVALAQDNATKFNGNFPTKQVRALWQVCSFTFLQKQPEIPLKLVPEWSKNEKNVASGKHTNCL